MRKHLWNLKRTHEVTASFHFLEIDDLEFMKLTCSEEGFRRWPPKTHIDNTLLDEALFIGVDVLLDLRKAGTIRPVVSIRTVHTAASNVTITMQTNTNPVNKIKIPTRGSEI